MQKPAEGGDILSSVSGLANKKPRLDVGVVTSSSPRLGDSASSKSVDGVILVDNDDLADGIILVEDDQAEVSTRHSAPASSESADDVILAAEDTAPAAYPDKDRMEATGQGGAADT